jgi:hypothetical protein
MSLPTDPAELATVYCTDEDIAVLCTADFATLVPKNQIVAQGSDGVFSSGDLWTINSASVSFAAQGVMVGHVVQITGPKSAFGGSGIQMAVSSVGANSVTLRRIGKATGWGQAPCPTGGQTGVSFAVVTFDPQIETASYDINGRYGIDPNFALVAPSQIYDLRALRQMTVLTIVVKAYRTDTRAKEGDFARKLMGYQQELSDVLARGDLKWNTITGENPQPATRFNTRVSR